MLKPVAGTHSPADARNLRIAVFLKALPVEGMSHIKSTETSCFVFVGLMCMDEQRNGRCVQTHDGCFTQSAHRPVPDRSHDHLVMPAPLLAGMTRTRPKCSQPGASSPASGDPRNGSLQQTSSIRHRRKTCANARQDPSRMWPPWGDVPQPPGAFAGLAPPCSHPFPAHARFSHSTCTRSPVNMQVQPPLEAPMMVPWVPMWPSQSGFLWPPPTAPPYMAAGGFWFPGPPPGRPVHGHAHAMNRPQGAMLDVPVPNRGGHGRASQDTDIRLLYTRA